MIGEKQKEFDLDSMQLLYYQAPLSALLLVLPVLWCEPISALVTRSWATIELVRWTIVSFLTVDVDVLTEFVIFYNRPPSLVPV